MLLAKRGDGYNQGHALQGFREWFVSVCHLAGLSDLRWHDLRHAFASRLVMAGVGLRDVREMMGHKTIAMTCRYPHLAPSHQLEAVRKLDTWGRKKQKQTSTRTDTGHLETQEPSNVNSDQVLVQ